MRFISFLFFQTRELIFIGATYLFSAYICSNLIFSCSTLKELSFSFFRVLCLFRFFYNTFGRATCFIGAIYSLSKSFCIFREFRRFRRI